jgi:hypothetical protein
MFGALGAAMAFRNQDSQLSSTSEENSVCIAAAVFGGNIRDCGIQEH